MHPLRAWLFFASLTWAQLESQNLTFNSTFHLTAAQKRAANLSEALAHSVEVALNFERSNNAGHLTQNDPFYFLPTNVNRSHLPPPGTILKVEEYTNTSFYTLPPTLSMSRFLYVTEALNGSSIPASAYVLWPYVPKKVPGLSACNGQNGTVYPLVGQAHGTSGQTQACAPSNLRNLWDAWNEPFALALNGYAVVAPDYAGYGVPEMPTPYFIFPSHANDLFHAVGAAQKQWPHLLSKEFILGGQSQGGGTAWAATQRQAQRPVEGYLGTYAASPFTTVLSDIAGEDDTQVNARVVGIAQGLDSVLPSFKLSDWLTDAAIDRLHLLQEIVGCSAPGGQLFSSKQGIQFLKDGWNETSAAQWYRNVSDNGAKPFAGPLLVLQGDSDPNAVPHVTTQAVNDTCAMFPDAQLEYGYYKGITHTPIMQSAYMQWMGWIEDRFNKKPVQKGCKMETVAPVRGVDNIVKNGDWVMVWDEYGL